MLSETKPATPAPPPTRRTKRGLSSKARDMSGLAMSNPAQLLVNLGVKNKSFRGATPSEKCLNFLKEVINGNMAMPMAYESPKLEGKTIVIPVKGQEDDEGEYRTFLGVSDAWRYISYAIGAAADGRTRNLSEDDRPTDVSAYGQGKSLVVKCTYD